MSDLKAGTTIGGQIAWSGANLPLLPSDNSLYFKNFLIYTENDKPGKVDVGLGSVENYGIASQSEAESGVSNVKYMTPLRSQQLLTTHSSRTDNPHGVTKEQVQLGLVQNYGLASTSEAIAGTTNSKYMTPLRNQEHFLSKTTTYSRNLLTKANALDTRGHLDVYSTQESDDKFALDTRVITAGDGLSGGGTLEANRTINVDSTVVRTSGNQIIGGFKTISNSGFEQIRINRSDTASNVVIGYSNSGSSTVYAGFDVDSQIFGIVNSTVDISTSNIKLHMSGRLDASTFYGNGANITSLNASNLSNGTVPTERLPATALIGDTTYSAGTGLSLSGTTFSVTNPFNPSGSYTGLRAQATTKSDVGLGNVPNVNTTNASNISSGYLSSDRLSNRAVPFTAQELSNTVDLDTLNGGSDVGFFYQTANADTSTARGYPVAQAGSLTVQKSSGVVQQYQTFGQNPRWFMRGYYGSSWGSWREMYHTGHKPTPGEIGALPTDGKASDSSRLNGLYLHSGRNDVANRVVRTNGSGYIDAGWINTTSGNTTNTVTDFYVNTNDGYIRKATKAHTKSQLSISWASNNSWGGMRHSTSNGYIDFGPANTAYAHIYTDRPGIYMNKPLSASSFQVTSDIRFKDNVQPITSNFGLQLKSWTWEEQEDIAREHINDTGVIAQDVEKVFPTCVSTDTEGYLSVDYGKLGVHHSIKLREEYEQEIELLKTQLNKVQNRTLFGFLSTLINKVIKGFKNE